MLNYRDTIIAAKWSFLYQAAALATDEEQQKRPDEAEEKEKLIPFQRMTTNKSVGLGIVAQKARVGTIEQSTVTVVAWRALRRTGMHHPTLSRRFHEQ